MIKVEKNNKKVEKIHKLGLKIPYSILLEMFPNKNMPKTLNYHYVDKYKNSSYYLDSQSEKLFRIMDDYLDKIKKEITIEQLNEIKPINIKKYTKWQFWNFNHLWNYERKIELKPYIIEHYKKGFFKKKDYVITNEEFVTATIFVYEQTDIPIFYRNKRKEKLLKIKLLKIKSLKTKKRNL